MRAFDVRTGAARWSFDPIPRNSELSRQTGAANVGLMAVDEARELVFLPTSSPSPDFFGGLRPGDNRYADSLVALKASTGEMVWHFQITHHNVWDYDLGSQPMLVDVERNGVRIPAVVQGTKQGLLFVFDRETGEPLSRSKNAPFHTTQSPASICLRRSPSNGASATHSTGHRAR